MSWTQVVAKTLNRIEHGIDRVRLFMMSQFGVRKPLAVRPYIGYSNGEQVFVRGRVVLQNRLREAHADDSLWRNLLNTYYRFESDEIPYATVRVRAGERERVVRCDEEGFFHVAFAPGAHVSWDTYWQVVQVEVVDTPVSGLDTSGTATDLPVIVPPANAQYGVISDLDDTIVQTDVLNLFKMLRNTLFRNAHTRLPFAGVAPFYQALHAGTGKAAAQNPIFYVSSSPWNLYDLIIEFYRVQEIPLGPVFLRDIGLSAHAVGARDHMGHKLGYISKLLERHPRLPFILIGDSGQKDVWVYAEAVRRYPGRIVAVYIRDVTHSAERRAEIAPVQATVAEMGSEMLLVTTTCEAAEHAHANDFITAAHRDTICAACAKAGGALAERGRRAGG